MIAVSLHVLGDVVTFGLFPRSSSSSLLVNSSRSLLSSSLAFSRFSRSPPSFQIWALYGQKLNLCCLVSPWVAGRESKIGNVSSKTGFLLPRDIQASSRSTARRRQKYDKSGNTTHQIALASPHVAGASTELLPTLALKKPTRFQRRIARKYRVHLHRFKANLQPFFQPLQHRLFLLESAACQGRCVNFAAQLRRLFCLGPGS